MSEAVRASGLRELWASSAPGTGSRDYALLATKAGIHVARSRDGVAALVIELPHVPPAAVGRHAAGFELLPHAQLEFAHQGRVWKAPAAALICAEPDLLEVFVVLAADVEQRVQGLDARSWQGVLAIVEDWQSLMAPRGRPSAESEIGIWGELWCLLAGVDVDRLVAAWRGPDRATADFFLDGRAVEVKTSRQRRRHHVSQSQVSEPLGSADAWLLSVWVGVDPIRGQTVPAMVDRLLQRACDPSATLRCLSSAGYVHADRRLFGARLVLLAEPEWYGISDVPRVRSADAGVSRLRYVVDLDQTRATTAGAPALWEDFLGCRHGVTQE